MNKLLKIDCILFRVKDLKKSSDFYEKVMGMKKKWIDEKRKMVAFSFAEGGTEEIIIHTDSKIKTLFNFVVEDVEKFCEYYKKIGYKILVKPKIIRCGKFAVLADPDGNKIPIVDWTTYDEETDKRSILS